MPVKEQQASHYPPRYLRAHAPREYRQMRDRERATPDTEDYELPKMPVIVRKYNQPQHVQFVVEDRRKKQVLQPKIAYQQERYHPMIYFLLGMLVLALALLLVNMFLAHLAGLTC